MKKILALSFLSLTFLFSSTPVASAVTIAELQAQVTALLAQIAAMQGQTTNSGSTLNGNSCYTFNQNLKLGDNGSPVQSLQTTLQNQGFTISSNEIAASTFGDSTKSAVTAFQQKYSNEILTPNGLTSGNGFVGVSTRAKLNQLYGCNKNIVTVSTPTVSLGDVNLDGVINNLDIQKVSSYVAFPTVFTTQQRNNADVNRDGKVDSTDINLITQYIAGNLTSFQSGSNQTVVATSPTLTTPSILPKTLADFSFSASANNVVPGQSATLTWSSTPQPGTTVSCTLADSNGNLSQGTPIASSGSLSVSPTALTIYRVSCMGSNGQGKSGDVGINVIQPALPPSGPAGQEVLNDGAPGTAVAINVQNNTNGFWSITCGGVNKVYSYGTKAVTVHAPSDGMVCIMNPGQVSGYNFPPVIWNSRSASTGGGAYLLVEPRGGGIFSLKY